MVFICKTVSQRLALLRRIQPFIDRETSLMFYNGYMLPILDYCIVWGTCSHNDLQRVIRMQKAAARIILGVGYDQRSHGYFY